MAGFAPRRLALPKGDRVLCHRWLPFGGLSRGAAGRLRKAGVLVFSLCSGYMHSGSNLTFLCSSPTGREDTPYVPGLSYRMVVGTQGKRHKGHPLENFILLGVIP